MHHRSEPAVGLSLAFAACIALVGGGCTPAPRYTSRGLQPERSSPPPQPVTVDAPLGTPVAQPAPAHDDKANSDPADLSFADADTSIVPQAATPSPEPSPARTSYREEGIATYYGPGFNGRKTASGERFDMRRLTAAHRTLVFGTRVRVTNLGDNRVVIVRINDRGPVDKDRIIDLSLGAARLIGLDRAGTARVRLEVIP
jgi:rare lipoprotein A